MRTPTECWVAAIRSPAARTGVRGEGGGLRKPRASAGCRNAGSRGSRGRRGGGGGRRAEEGREERRGQESGRRAAGEEARKAQQGRRGGVKLIETADGNKICTMRDSFHTYTPLLTHPHNC